MSMKVLIVDADSYFLRQAREFLESRAHYVVHEPEADKALARAFRWKPDVVIISAEIPNVYQGRLLKDLQSIQPRPAILLTARLDRFDLAWQAWQQGGDELVVKPVLHASELHVAITTAMQNAVNPVPRAREHQAAQALSA